MKNTIFFQLISIALIVGNKFQLNIKSPCGFVKRYYFKKPFLLFI